jgi:pimeloyl-ACP methyl ester carboxylesterase
MRRHKHNSQDGPRQRPGRGPGRIPDRERGRRRWRRRGPWAFLALLLGGVLVALLTGRRDDAWPWDEDEEKPGRPGAKPGPAASNPPASTAAAADERSADLAVWIAGPAGNLYVRDGGPGAGSDAPVAAASHGLLPVLFVHSLGGNGGQWSLQLDHLRHERRAAALDLRGHGESDPAEDGDYTLPGMAADIAAAADQLGLRRFVLAGHSLGAAVAIEYAGRHPERVAGLLLADPNGDQTLVPRDQIEPFLEAVRADPVAEVESYFKQLLIYGDRAAATWVLEDLRATHEDALTGALEGAARHSPLPALARYAGPRLAIVSDLNNLPFSLHRLVADLPAQLLPGTGHWLMVDRPEPFNRLLDDFLESVEEPG